MAEVREYLRENNLIDLCTTVSVDWEAVLEDPDAIAGCEKIGISESEIRDAVEGEYGLGLNAADVYDADLSEYADWEWAEFDEFIFSDIISAVSMVISG